MSTYEQDREDRAVGPELCPECLHPLRLHSVEGCEFNSDHHLADFGAVAGTCGCTGEPDYEMGRRTSGSFGDAQQRLSRALDLLTSRVAGHLEAR